MRRALCFFAGALLVLGARGASALPAVSQPVAFDTPNDGGRSITIRWETAEFPPDAMVVVERVSSTGEAEEVGRVPAADGTVIDGSSAEGALGPPDGKPFTYRLRSVAAADSTALAGGEAATTPAISGEYAGRSNTSPRRGQMSAFSSSVRN